MNAILEVSPSDPTLLYGLQFAQMVPHAQRLTIEEEEDEENSYSNPTLGSTKPLKSPKQMKSGHQPPPPLENSARTFNASPVQGELTAYERVGGRIINIDPTKYSQQAALPVLMINEYEPSPKGKQQSQFSLSNVKSLEGQQMILSSNFERQ
jgi:hypothetical protein